MELEILDNDRFFRDSPDAGEPECICSRCHKMIKEEEVPLRMAVDQEVLYASIIKIDKVEVKKTDAANGLEFRLCEACQNGIGLKSSFGTYEP